MKFFDLRGKNADALAWDGPRCADQVQDFSQVLGPDAKDWARLRRRANST